MKEKTYGLTIFLMKEHVTEFQDCIKKNLAVRYSNIKAEYEIDGRIITPITRSNTRPRWEYFLKEFSEDELKVSDNVSNKD